MYILVQKGPKCLRLTLANNGRGLRNIIYPMTGLLKLRFEWQMFNRVISLPIKRILFFPNFWPSCKLLKTSQKRSRIPTWEAVTSATPPVWLMDLTGVNRIIISTMELRFDLIYPHLCHYFPFFISEAKLMTSPLLIRIYFVGAPYLIESYLKNLGFSTVFPCAMSLEVTMVIFKDIYSSKLNPFSYWHWTCFLLGFSSIPPVICLVSVVASTPLNVLISKIQSMFPIHSNAIYDEFYSWVTNIFVATSNDASTSISTASGYIRLNRKSPICAFILPHL